ncbi:vitamin B12 ABC transporter substrate-binding protein BtuF [Dickeya solani]|uniref:Vitamin B12-binding protein n=1 Tax=Dickeya solani D s0432-1 TaxID=1231725 RepID=A0AAV3K889_9GAMM|nr:Vitamin B12 ABC transporter, B12-binding component BtuF [Dickeya solani RNS 08.23.3.1.A]AYQ48954.1 Vitamin B12-binding protein precursor [Dickeya solani]ERO56556.1 Vitamin B12-binding protein [Dickeya solani D s0432-1]AYQ53117.1 Vitamin B12-binding protein precursor [Dickeya solani]MBD3603211.1 vitamin B12 ABC transporter substrate-binding protein BtuF [Dickeya solani]
MKSVYFPILWLLTLLWLPFCRAEPVAQRVVSLAPHATEMAFAAGLGERLVGVSAWSNYPPEAERIEQVANWQGINLERILALKPDLVLAWREGNAQRPLEQLASFGIRILYLDPPTLDDIPRQLEMLAQYSPHPEQAREAALRFRRQQQTLTQQYGHSTPVRVFLQFGSQPLFTSSRATLQSQVVSLCGGENVFADSQIPWPQVSREQVIRRQPQVIVISGPSGAAEQVRAFWQPQLNPAVIAVNEDWFSRTGPRLMLAAEQLCQQFAASRR